MREPFYVTTPIYYVNSLPHIGHAYTSITADSIARFMRLVGKDVFFLSGTDEHGQKVAQAASNKGMSPKEFTDEMSLPFQNLLKILNISNDQFIRTTDKKHHATVQLLWKKLWDNGQIYLGKYSGWYAIRDEAFYDESELTPEGLAPTGAEVTWVEGDSYFFKLSEWQDKLLEFYERNPDFIKPASRRNEVVNFVKNGLIDLSISRTTFDWGVRVPNDEKHVIYVWLDALTNYLSALDITNNSQQYKKYWPADLQVIGKDILRFHAIYWPAFLMAADIEPPKSVFAHGWWMNEGQKISKSIGNVIDPFALVEEFGSDYLRYFLMREITFGNDGSYSRNNLVNRINSELANKIGNLLQRTSAFIHKYCGGTIPNLTETDVLDIYQSELFNSIFNLTKDSLNAIKDFEINKILGNIVNIANEANTYMDKEAPWSLRDSDPVKMAKVLYALLEAMRHIGIMLLPFVPLGAGKILDQLCISESEREFIHLTSKYALKSGGELLVPTPVFPKIE